MTQTHAPVPLAIGLTTDQTASGQPLTPADWRKLIARLDEAAEFVTIADAFAAPGLQGPDAILLANWLGAQTRNLGILPGSFANFHEPFHISTAIATLDFITKGRAGLLLQAADSDLATEALAAIGQSQHYPTPEGDDLRDDLADSLTAIRALWDSWQDDAVIRNVPEHRYLDADRLHHIHFAGKHFSIAGPSITPRPPQGQPLVALAARGADDPAAAVGADLLFLPSGLNAPAEGVIWGDLTVAYGGEAASRPGQWQGAPGQLTAHLRELHHAGLKGWRLSPADPARDLTPLLAELPALREAGLIAAPRSGDLRSRLGFAPAPNRYASPLVA
ncbi:LLM class flavin-dependent oxidoreductase [Paracoccus aminophilus]|uniref:Monooxygenase n=1 Tax=Paracoccus aminophilus JCM 7686 TaxID=1367847 RepID=S5Y550_PARAH|nr:LLM class flavin-dependent oxidoreductase [Paracoccus aminophilus]AGT10860.1 monooxygenase [Paracoccus aminophilus JCM 7686]